MTISEKVAYIQGMFDGMDLDKSDSKEARILAEVLDVLTEIGDQLEDMDATLDGKQLPHRQIPAYHPPWDADAEDGQHTAVCEKKAPQRKTAT